MSVQHCQPIPVKDAYKGRDPISVSAIISDLNLVGFALFLPLITNRLDQIKKPALNIFLFYICVEKKYYKFESFEIFMFNRHLKDVESHFKMRVRPF